MRNMPAHGGTRGLLVRNKQAVRRALAAACRLDPCVRWIEVCVGRRCMGHGSACRATPAPPTNRQVARHNGAPHISSEES